MYAYVISPLSDKIRLVVASGDGPMLKYIVTEDDFRYVTTTMNKGEQLTYVLILANANKRGIQKLELAYERKCCVQLCGFTSFVAPLILRCPLHHRLNEFTPIGVCCRVSTIPCVALSL